MFAAIRHRTEHRDKLPPPHEHPPRKRTLLSTAVKHERVCYAIGRTSPSASSPSPPFLVGRFIGLRTGRALGPVYLRVQVWWAGRSRPFPRPPSCSFDHLVGAGEERGRDCQAECLCGVQVDHQLEFRGSLNRHLACQLTF